MNTVFFSITEYKSPYAVPLAPIPEKTMWSRTAAAHASVLQVLLNAVTLGRNPEVPDDNNGKGSSKGTGRTSRAYEETNEWVTSDSIYFIFIDIHNFIRFHLL